MDVLYFLTTPPLRDELNRHFPMSRIWEGDWETIWKMEEAASKRAGVTAHIVRRAAETQAQKEEDSIINDAKEIEFYSFEQLAAI